MKYIKEKLTKLLAITRTLKSNHHQKLGNTTLRNENITISFFRISYDYYYLKAEIVSAIFEGFSKEQVNLKPFVLD